MKALIIGGGSIGKRHIKNLLQIGVKEVYCLRRAKDETFEKETGAQIVTSYEQADTLKVDAVFICTPTSLHNEGLKFAVKHQAAVLMEKPLIHSAEGLREAQEILKEHRNVFFIGFMLRFHPLVQQLKNIIDKKELGAVYHARFEFGSFLPYWHPWEDHRTSYASLKALGGGVINTITHELDLIQYFFGDPLSVVSQKANLRKLDIEVEEISESVLNYGDKMVSLHLDYLQKDYDRNIKILCDEGKIIWNWHDNKIIVKKHKEEAVEIFNEKDFDVNQLYIDELHRFITLVKTKQEQHDLNKQHAFQNTHIMLKMHESADQGIKVSLK